MCGKLVCASSVYTLDIPLNHVKRGKCFSCKSQNHHATIREKLESPTPQTTKTEHKPDNGKTDVHLVTSKTSVLLQTAIAIASDNKEKRQLPVKVFIATYLSQRLVDYLKLIPMGKQTMIIKTFGNENERV